MRAVAVLQLFVFLLFLLMCVDVPYSVQSSTTTYLESFSYQDMKKYLIHQSIGFYYPFLT